jgi:hypothetical protein
VEELGQIPLALLLARVLGVEFCFTERVSAASDGGLYRARYRLPPAFAGRLRGMRVAMVNDVMSAGSALRGTYAELRAHGAAPVVAGALLILGAAGADFFAERGIDPPADPKTIASGYIALDIGLAIQHYVDPDDAPSSLWPDLFETLFGPYAGDVTP